MALQSDSLPVWLIRVVGKPRRCSDSMQDMSRRRITQRASQITISADFLSAARGVLVDLREMTSIKQRDNFTSRDVTLSLQRMVG
jgi:hypothetical protein